MLVLLLLLFFQPGLKSMLLEKRVEVLSEALEMKDAQLGEVLAAAHLDPATLQQVRAHARLNIMLLSCLQCLCVRSDERVQCAPAVHCIRYQLTVLTYTKQYVYGFNSAGQQEAGRGPDKQEQCDSGSTVRCC